MNKFTCVACCASSGPPFASLRQGRWKLQTLFMGHALALPASEIDEAEAAALALALALLLDLAFRLASAALLLDFAFRSASAFWWPRLRLDEGTGNSRQTYRI